MSNSAPKKIEKPTTRKLRAEDLIVDPMVQREVDPKRVRQMAADLNLSAIGVLCVSERENGDLVVLDGGHRRGALIEADKGKELVTCEVYKGLDLATEAMIFRYRNNTQKVGYIDRYRVRLVEGEENAVAVELVANKHGWAVVGGTNEGGMPVLHSVQKLEEWYKRNPDVANETLKIATGAWGHDPDAVDYRILGGLAAFLYRYWDEVDSSDLENRLANYKGGPNALMRQAAGLREIRKVPAASAIAELITDVYNKGRKYGSRISGWRA